MNKLIRALCLLLAALLAQSALQGCAEIFIIPNGVAAIESEAFADVSFPDGVLIPPSVSQIGENAFTADVIYGLEGSAAQAYAQSHGVEFRAAGISELSVEAPAFASPFRPFQVKTSCVSPLPVEYTVRFIKNGECLVEVPARDGVASATLFEGGLYDISVTAQTGISQAEAYFEGEIEILEPVRLIAPSWTVRIGEAFCPVDESETRSVTLSCDDPAVSIQGGSVQATATGVYTVTAQTECDGLPIYTDFTLNCVIPVDALTTSQADVQLYIGERFTPEISALPENASPYSLNYAISDPAVASVDTQGTVTALSQGECVLSVSTFDASADILISVRQPAQALSVSEERITLQTGAQQQLGFEIAPSDAGDVAVFWSSSDPSVASVTPRTGLVTGLTPGSCQITARLSSQTELEASVSVTVTQGVTDIQAEIPAVLYAGDSFTIQPVVLPEEAAQARIQYAVSDESVLAVSPAGELDALNPGRARVTLTAPNWVSASYEVQVYERCEAIVPRISELVLNPGLTADAALLFSFLPTGVPVENAVYTSSDPAVLSVDASGRISALSAGSASIEARLDDAVCVLPVRVVTDGSVVTSVSLSQYYAVLTPGGTVSVTPSFGSAASRYKRGAWYSDAPQVVSVASTASNGTVTLKAVNPGRASVTLLCSSGASASLLLIVNPIAVKSISVQAPAQPLYPGDSIALSYTCTPLGADTSGVFLYSSDDSVATVSEDGVITAVGAGQCDIFVSCDTALASCSVTVNGRPMTSAALLSDTLFGMAGQSASIQYTFEPQDASPARFAWQSDNPEIADVSAGGLVSFISAGTALLHGTATDGSGLQLKLYVEVSEIPLRALDLDFDSLDLEYGQSRQIGCAVYPPNASYGEARFTSSDESVALVDDNGMVTALREGSAVIFVTAGHGDFQLTRTVEVNVTRPLSTVYRAFIMGQFTVPGADGYLPFSVNGTRGVYDAISQSTLGGAAYQINFLPASPSVESVRAALSRLAQQADADDVTFIYLLTHGSYTDSAGYYLQFSNGANYYADQLIADVSRISGHVVLVLCTCHSGRVFGSAKLKAIVNAGGAYTGTNGEGHLSVLCSSTDTNSSYYRTLNALQSYDFYTRAFSQGLGWNMLSDVPAALAADANGDARVTLTELAPYSRSKTQQLISSFVQLHGTSDFGGNQNQFPRYFIASGDEDLAITERR